MNCSKYTQIRLTGIGAVNVPFLGKKIVFDEDGNYPVHTVEHVLQENAQLRLRNLFLEDAMHRACEEEVVEHDIYDMENYVYCWTDKKNRFQMDLNHRSSG